VVFSPYPAPGRRGVLDADGTVRIETDDGEAMLVRERARAAFGDPRHLLWWDTLDILYFGAYAMWTYTSTPFLFARDNYGLRELEPWTERGETWRRLDVTFPATVQKHAECRRSTSMRMA
jgi:hypothetical protein